MAVKRLPPVPAGIDANLRELLDLSTFMVRGDPITSTFSTGEVPVFAVPANTILLGVMYRITTAFVDDSAGVPPSKILLGDTSDFSKYGILTAAQLGVASKTGWIWCGFEDTADATLTATVVNVSDTAPAGAGSVELTALYSPTSRGQRLVDKFVR